MNEIIETENNVENNAAEEMVEVYSAAKDSIVGWGAGGCASGGYGWSDLA